MNRLLIVDDEYYIRQMLRAAVNWQAIDYEIVGEAEDGQEALREIERLRPDAALIDINIPKLFGLDLIERIAQDYPQLCVVILSAYDKFSYAQQAVRLGVFDYLLKPIDPNAIRDTFVRLQSRIAEAAQQPASDAQADDTQSSLVKRVRQTLLSHYEDPDFSPASVAQILHVDPGHMARIYRQETGGTVMDELIATRLCAARRILEKNPLTPVAQVAYMCGYSDPLYFSKAFKKRFGATPQQVRKHL